MVSLWPGSIFEQGAISIGPDENAKDSLINRGEGAAPKIARYLPQ